VIGPRGRLVGKSARCPTSTGKRVALWWEGTRVDIFRAADFPRLRLTQQVGEIDKSRGHRLRPSHGHRHTGTWLKCKCKYFPPHHQDPPGLHVRPNAKASHSSVSPNHPLSRILLTHFPYYHKHAKKGSALALCCFLLICLCVTHMGPLPVSMRNPRPRFQARELAGTGTGGSEKTQGCLRRTPRTSNEIQSVTAINGGLM
jgi:hypothetical protein